MNNNNPSLNMMNNNGMNNGRMMGNSNMMNNNSDVDGRQIRSGIRMPEKVKIV